LPADLAVQYARADKLVLSKLRAKLGLDQVKWAVSGAAPIPPEVLAFFSGLGIPIAEAWGMSELSCIASVVPPAEHRLGTVGRLLPGMEGRIAEDGEFLVRGPLVTKGYRGEPGKTAEAIEDGWLHTGDVMTMDGDGYLTVVDRKKELIINAAGKNISPANIENAMKAACPLLGGIVAIGDRRPYNTALAVLDAETAAAYAAPARAAGRLGRHPGRRPRRGPPDPGGHRRRQHPAGANRAGQAVPHPAGLLGARRGRAHADHEASPQADHPEVRRRDRSALRRLARSRRARARGRPRAGPGPGPGLKSHEPERAAASAAVTRSSGRRAGRGAAVHGHQGGSRPSRPTSKIAASSRSA
jgi:acyl-CoA synthetase (AMP-forming)/AMP-acid ligase II